MAGILDFISTIPGARITSTRRDPNSPLGRANPRSYHNIGQAVDVAPIPGMSFDQYVNRIKAAGYNVVEARDEAKHPVSWTTGPNWHIAYGRSASARPSQPIPAQGGEMPTFGSGPQVGPYGTPTMGITESPLGIEQNEPTGLTGILQSNMTAAPANSHPLQKHFFDKGGTGLALAGIIADALAGLGGRQGGFAPAYLQGQEDDRNLALWREKVAQDRQDRLDAANIDLQKGLALQEARNAHPAPGALQKNIEYLRQLNPNLTDVQAAAIAERYMNRPIMIGGQPFGYEDGGDTGGGGPQPGAVEDGFVFMGGDPSDQANWRPQ